MLRNILLIAVVSVSIASAAIAPMFYQRYRQEAPEHVVVRVVNLKQTTGPTGMLRIVASVQIIRVSKTGTGLVRGANIQIEYGTQSPSSRRESMSCAPPPIPMLSKGATTTAFLYRRPGSSIYSPAAAHESFTAVVE